MYQVGGWIESLRASSRTTGERTPRAIPANVFLLGLTSLFTDISTEMVVSILPVYLVGFLGLSPVQFGIVDGIYQGIAGLVQLASAVVTDRFKRYKEMAALGYVASALCRAGFLFTTAWTGLTALLTLDRLGKGIRTAPRDALISLSAPPDRLGTAFGIHRAMDAAGAMAGPLVAFAILRGLPDRFDVVFVASLCIAVIGLAVLALAVQNREPAGDMSGARVIVNARAAIALLAEPAFRHLAIAALLLSSLTISDAFVYLTLQQRVGIPMSAFPLLYVLTSTCYLLFAVPVGQYADRFGRFRLFIGGHAALLMLYAALTTLSTFVVLVPLTVVLLGVHYAATEGVLMARGSALVPERLRTSGLAVLTTALALASLGSSAAFGICWSRFGLRSTVIGYLAGLALAIGVLLATQPSE